MTALPELLDTAAVLARYGLRDPRAARRVMAEAGAFRVGRRLLVRADRLAEWEEAQEAAAEPAPAAREAIPAPRRDGSTPRGSREPLRPGFWRESAGGD